mmetsp:Transcript_11002/g.44308  ORF Transcript_11002/g.44308 Transcript_11002/m.44308 type:complete len:226 (+) Transcript_11002:1811-2488(+)
MFPITEIFSSTPSLIPASQLQHPLAQTRRDRRPRPVRKLLVDVCHLPRRLRLPHSRRPRRGLVHRGGGDLPDLRLLLALEHSLGHLRDVRQTRPRPERTALFRRDVRAQSHGVLQLHPRRDAVAHRPDERVPGSRRVHHRRFLQLHRRREYNLHRPERRGRLVARRHGSFDLGVELELELLELGDRGIDLSLVLLLGLQRADVVAGVRHGILHGLKARGVVGHGA